MKSARQIAYAGIAAALLVASKYALAPVAGFEVVTLLIFVFAAALGLTQTLFAVLAMILVDTAVYGIQPWVLMYVLHFPLLSLLARFVAVRRYGDIAIALIGGAMTLVFSLQSCFIESLFYGYTFGARFLTGAIVFIINTATNIILLLFLYKPLVKAVKRVTQAAD